MATVRSERDGGRLTLIIDREAQRNAVDAATLDALEAALHAARSDAGVRVIVLRGAGERAFCAGADLREIASHESIAAARHHFDGVARVMRAMQEAPTPVITRVPGYALAGGFGLAVAGDFTLASESAVFGLPEIGIGLLPLMVSVPIQRALGNRKRLLDLVLTGRRIGAAEALALGVVTRVVTDAALDAELDGLVDTLQGLSPSTLRLGKEAIYTMTEMEEHAALRYLREMIVLTSLTDDAREGVRAFLEKRRPTWTGR